jgi:hypothetical protein
MENIKKNAVKIMFLIALSASLAFADGDMSGGGLTDNGDGSNEGDVVITKPTADPAPGTDDSSGTTDTDSLLNAIYEYLNLII